MVLETIFLSFEKDDRAYNSYCGTLLFVKSIKKKLYVKSWNIRREFGLSFYYGHYRLFGVPVFTVNTPYNCDIFFIFKLYPLSY